MASSNEDARMPNLSLEEVASFVADLLDLSDVHGSDLRKFNHTQTSEMESQGAVYKDFYRQLQISPASHDQFYNVLRVTRNKHIDDLKRGSAASIKLLTDLLLRGYGYIVWKEDSSWLLPAHELDEGEHRLTYVRGQRQDIPENARFYSILAHVWPRMRNIIFEQKPALRKRGRAPSRASPALTNDSETDIAYLGDTDTHPLPSPALSFYRPRDTTELRARVLSATLSHETQAPRKMLTARQADDAIVDLIERVAAIRADTDPRVFEELWERRIGRLEELDHPPGIAEGNQGAPGPVTETPEQGTSAPTAPTPRPLSSEPFASTGNPIPPPMPLSCLVPPMPPTHMSIWISSCGIISTASLFSVPLITASTIYSSHGSGKLTASVSSPAYHWPNAPMENSDLVPFFLGMNSRINPPTSTIIGWIFSYGWNDRCRFVSSGLTELCNNADADEQESQCGGGAQEPDAELAVEMDIDDHHAPSVNEEMTKPQQLSPTKSTPQSTSSIDPSTATTTSAADMAQKNADFDEEQWASIKLGWRDFQADLREAARMGVKVWRMKVCVLNLTQ